MGRGKARLPHKGPCECLQFFSISPETGPQCLCPLHSGVRWSSACRLCTIVSHIRRRLTDVLPIGTPPAALLVPQCSTISRAIGYAQEKVRILQPVLKALRYPEPTLHKNTRDQKSCFIHCFLTTLSTFLSTK